MVLSPEEADHFTRKGWLKVSQGISRHQALLVQAYIANYLRVHRGIDIFSEAFPLEEIIQIQSEFAGEPFDSCLTERLSGYLDALTAPYGRSLETDVGHWGWWSINSHYGANLAWDIPVQGWHWDGASFQHSVSECHKVGIVMLCLFSDVESRGGATLLAEGSHKAVIATLRDADCALELTAAWKSVRATIPWIAQLAGGLTYGSPVVAQRGGPSERQAFFALSYRDTRLNLDFRVVEATGKAGDVFLCHPFLIHAASYNHRQTPRFLCNRFAPFLGPLTLRKELEEESILDRIAMGCEVARVFIRSSAI